MCVTTVHKDIAYSTSGEIVIQEDVMQHEYNRRVLDIINTLSLVAIVFGEPVRCSKGATNWLVIIIIKK